ncbi:magnesium transporter [Myxococcota bacterium]|nr:magnesium transporter [Myxococcota bacterium]
MPVQSATLDFVRRLLHREAIGSLKKVLAKLQPADVSDLITRCTPGERHLLITLLYVTRQAGPVLAELPDETMRQTLEGLSNDVLSRVLQEVGADDSALLLQRLPKERCAEILDKLPPAYADKIEEIFRYPPDSAGAYMNTLFLQFHYRMTAREAVDRMRAWFDTHQEPIYTLYVLEETQRLMGTVAVHKLVLAQPETMLAELIDPDPVCVNDYSSVRDAAETMVKYDYVSMPVVDDQFRLLGIITVDDMVDVMMESAAADAFQIHGVADEDRLETPMGTSLRLRLPWMLLNLMTAFIASSIVGLFEASIQQVVALATFMPIVAGLGGNTGTQSLAVIIRALALDDVDAAAARRGIVKQVLVSLMLGLAAGLITALIALLWRGNPMLGLVIFAAMVLNMLLAGFVGSAVPFLLKRLRQDPAVGGGVLVTACTDSLGFLGFLGISTIFLAYL